MITKIDSELAAIKLMDENLTALDEQFLAGNLSSEELIRAKALSIIIVIRKIKYRIPYQNK